MSSMTKSNLKKNITLNKFMTELANKLSRDALS